VSGQLEAAATFLPEKEDPVPSDVNIKTGKIVVEMRKISVAAGNQIHVLHNVLPDYSK
jgi:hypothetical protein